MEDPFEDWTPEEEEYYENLMKTPIEVVKAELIADGIDPDEVVADIMKLIKEKSNEARRKRENGE